MALRPVVLGVVAAMAIDLDLSGNTHAKVVGMRDGAGGTVNASQPSTYRAIMSRKNSQGYNGACPAGCSAITDAADCAAAIQQVLGLGEAPAVQGPYPYSQVPQGCTARTGVNGGALSDAYVSSAVGTRGTGQHPAHYDYVVVCRDDGQGTCSDFASSQPECTCEHGQAATGDACVTEGNPSWGTTINRCASCNAGYHLSGTSSNVPHGGTSYAINCVADNPSQRFVPIVSRKNSRGYNGQCPSGCDPVPRDDCMYAAQQVLPQLESVPASMRIGRFNYVAYGCTARTGVNGGALQDVLWGTREGSTGQSPEHYDYVTICQGTCSDYASSQPDCTCETGPAATGAACNADGVMNWGASVNKCAPTDAPTPQPTDAPTPEPTPSPTQGVSTCAGKTKKKCAKGLKKYNKKCGGNKASSKKCSKLAKKTNKKCKDHTCEGYPIA